MFEGQLSIAVQPAEEPVSLAEAKLHLRVDGADEDLLIGRLIVAARVACEHEARRAFVSRTCELRLDAWPPACLELPMPPLASVQSITYTADDGSPGSVPAASYVVYAGVEPGQVVLKPAAAWPNVSLMPGPSLVVRFVAGYGAAADVPAIYKQALLLMVGHLYENREAVVVGAGVHELPQAARALLQADRVSWW